MNKGVRIVAALSGCGFVRTRVGRLVEHSPMCVIPSPSGRKRAARVMWRGLEKAQ
jgi:hypothetical protein